VHVLVAARAQPRLVGRLVATAGLAGLAMVQVHERPRVLVAADAAAEDLDGASLLVHGYLSGMMGVGGAAQ